MENPPADLLTIEASSLGPLVFVLGIDDGSIYCNIVTNCGQGGRMRSDFGGRRLLRREVGGNKIETIHSRVNVLSCQL